MKMILFILVFLPSMTAMGCSQLNNHYYCPEEAEDHFYLGSRHLSLSFDSEKQIMTMTQGTNINSYPLDHWQPVPGTHTFRKAHCVESKINLFEKFDSPIETEVTTIDAELELILRDDGVTVRRLMNKQEVFNIFCKKTL